MRRHWSAIVLQLFCIALAAQAQDAAEARIETTRVNGNVYLLASGAGGANLAVSVGDDGMFLVDASYARLVEANRAALRELSAKPVRYLVNTHYHGDHTTGNVGFPEAVIIAHDNARKLLASSGFGGNFATFRFPYSPLAPQALPALTFQQSLTIHFNGEDIRIVHFPTSHTDGDVIVYFPDANVAHLGDLFTVYGFPDIDIAGGANTEGWIATLDEIVRMLPADTKIVPGHGPISTIEDVRRLRNMLRGTLEAVKHAMARGKSLSQMKQEQILSPWKEWAGFFSADVYLDMLYNDIVDTSEWPVRTQPQ